jgi:phenylacetate-coenzyme A ligase PaaK-like adenylate-forming protein
MMSFRNYLFNVIYKVRGADSSVYADDCKEMSYADSRLVEKVRNERLVGIIRHASRNVPYYRDLFQQLNFASEDLINAGTLSDLPILSKEQLRRGFAEMLAQDVKRKVARKFTSGSSGSPICVVRDSAQHQWHLASKRRAYEWYDCRLNQRAVVFVGGTPSRLRCLLRKLNDLIVGRLRVSAYDQTPEYFDRVAEKIKKRNYRVVAGYPSAISSFCKYCHRKGVDLTSSNIRLIVPTAEMLHDDQRELMQEVFGAPVMNEYGCIETGSVAFSCKYGTMHVMNDVMMVEVLDDAGLACAEGEIGRITITPLMGKAMPLLRYQNGDMGSLARKECKCGFQNGMPVLEKIVGREIDYIVKPNGDRMHASIISHAAKIAMQNGCVDEYQVAQTDQYRLEIRYVSRDDLGGDFIANLASILQNSIGDGVRVECRRVENIDRFGSGKFKYFVNETRVN